MVTGFRDMITREDEKLLFDLAEEIVEEVRINE